MKIVPVMRNGDTHLSKMGYNVLPQILHIHKLGIPVFLDGDITAGELCSNTAANIRLGNMVYGNDIEVPENLRGTEALEFIRKTVEARYNT